MSLKKVTLSLIVTVIIFIPVWVFVIIPQMIKIPETFHYSAEVFSIDNFYDEEKGEYGGEQISVTQFSYDAVAENDGVLTIKNIFDVRTPAGEPIFSVERQYGIDPKTGKHVVGFGDKNRGGYLFAPKGLKKGEPFSYWHINYDGPALMTYAETEEILGLTVYRYDSNYEGVNIDQTENLSFLPGVSTVRGINLDPYLQIWIEPKTGRLIKYEDRTTAYYYNLLSGERLHPWNQFGNRYTQSSVAEQVRIAKREIQKQTLLHTYIPLSAVLIVLLSLFAAYYRKQNA